ncbi:putative phage abortive infection protein [uncultured Pontibacter sp.]|uniref:putative phage abortive infection protein n=1 Tax=uncultured Pontibacter sp. TaxID=453356 RepID=UPI002625D53A|nr:putative phage abortive infection protein [uncultured Pontibacter sp.]
MKRKKPSIYINLISEYGVSGTIIFVASGLAILISLIVTGVFIWNFSESVKIGVPSTEKDFTVNGIIGDFFGGVIGSLLSFIGVLLFFLALRLQSKELSLQRKELADTREVFTIQQFENTFFSLLKTQQDIRLNINVTHNKEIVEFDEYSQEHYSSIAVFDYLRSVMRNFRNVIIDDFNELDNIKKVEQPSRQQVERKQELIDEIVALTGENNYESVDTPEKISKAAYRYIYIIYSNQLGHYFRNLYHILLYLQDNEMRDRRFAMANFYSNSSDFSLEYDLGEVAAKYKKYAAFVQAQMNSNELFLLFYNSLFFPKLKNLLYHFNFLENLNTDDLLDPDNDIHLYGEWQSINDIYDAMIFKSKSEILKL